MKRGTFGIVLVTYLGAGAIGRAQSGVGIALPSQATTAATDGAGGSRNVSASENPADGIQRLPGLLTVFGLEPPQHQFTDYQASILNLLSKVNSLAPDNNYYDRQREGAQAALMLATGAWSTGELDHGRATSLYSLLARFFLRPLANEPQLKGTAEATGICSAVQGSLERACRMHYCLSDGGNEPSALADAIGQFNSSCYPVSCSTYRCAQNEQRWTQLRTEFDSLYAAQAGIALASSFGAQTESASLSGAIGSWAGRLSDAENATQGSNFAYLMSGTVQPAISVRRSVAATLTRYLVSADASVLAEPVKALVATAEEVCSKAAASGTAMDFANCGENLRTTAPLIAAPAAAEQ